MDVVYLNYEQKERQREFEFNRLKENKRYIENAIVSLYNRYSLRVIENKLNRFLYNDTRINLSLAYLWTIFAIDDYNATPNHFDVVIFDAETHSLTDHCLHFYLVPNGQNEKGYIQYKSVDESDYNAIRIKYKADHNKELNGEESNYIEALTKCGKFLDEVKHNLYINKSSFNDFKRYIEEFNAKYKYLTDMELVNYANYNTKTIKLTDIINGALDYEIYNFINVTNCSENDINQFKYFIYNILNYIFIRNSLIIVRKSVINDIEQNGIESVVSNIEIDNSLNLGSFRYVNQLIELGKESYTELVNHAFKEETNPEQLNKLLLQLLKLYYEFNHPSEKNHTYLSEFLINNKITKSKFVSDLCDWSDSVCTLWSTFDTKQKKQFAERLPVDSTYRIRKTVYIRKSVYNTKKAGKWERTDSTAVYGSDLLEKLRGVMVIFNEENEHTRILDINEGPNDSYIFDFITYKIEDTDVDGRRLGEFTAMFNRAFDETLYLTYNNE